MTEVPRAHGAPAAARGRTVPVAIWAAAATFLLVLTLLALQVAAGRDPALRARAAAVPLPARRVLLRKIYERRVIVHLPASSPLPPARASQQISPAGAYPTVVTRAS